MVWAQDVFIVGENGAKVSDMSAASFIQAKIYKPSKSAMQSGRAKTDSWVLEYEEGKRESEPLMGWTSSGDTLNQVRLKFSTLDEAQHFAQEHGYEYTVLPSHEKKIKPRNYSDGFRYIPPEE